jgi:hypothetical protein
MSKLDANDSLSKPSPKKNCMNHPTVHYRLWCYPSSLCYFPLLGLLLKSQLTDTICIDDGGVTGTLFTIGDDNGACDMVHVLTTSITTYQASTDGGIRI